MPYPNHALMVFGGTWSTPGLEKEIWTTSLRLTSGFTAGAPWQEIAEEAAAKVTDYVTTDAFPTACELTFVKFNPIGTDGKYAIEDQTYQVDIDPPAQGTKTGGLIPLQNSVVVTLLTARRRGIASKGRMFLPGVSPSELTGAGLLNTTGQAARLNATVTFLIAMRNWTADYNGTPAVVSAGAAGGTGDGVAEPVLGVSVGNVIDTQRRRRNALTPEDRLTEDLLGNF